MRQPNLSDFAKSAPAIASADRDSRNLPVGAVLRPLVLALAFASQSAEAVNAGGPLADFLVDASQGEFDTSEAAGFANLLNELDLNGYALKFSDGDTIPLTLSPDALDAALLAKEQSNAELRGLTGPKGQFDFAQDAESDANCSSSGDATGLNALLNCLGTEYRPSSAVEAATTAISQVNTIDLLIVRPTTQFMVAIRSFIAPINRARVPANQAPAKEASGGGSGDSDGDNTFFAGPWGVYLQGGGSFGKLNGSAAQAAYRVNNQLATGGVDYRFSDQVVAGMLFNYTASDTRFARATGRLGADLYRFMPFVSITPFDNAYVDIMAGYSYQTYSASRSGAGSNASSEYSADQVMASINLGYTVPIGSLEITGFAGGSYIGTEVGGYREKGRGTLLNVGSYRVTSWTTSLGTQLAYAISTHFGVLQPQMRLEWVHEFDNRPSNLNVTVSTLGNLALPISTSSSIHDWGNVTAGLQTVLPNGINAFVNYQGQIFSGGENHTVEGGVRLEF